MWYYLKMTKGKVASYSIAFAVLFIAIGDIFWFPLIVVLPILESTCKRVLFKFTYIRSSSPEVFCKKDVLKNFTKFTVKPLCQSLFFNKVAGLFIKKETLAQGFYCKFCEIFKNIFFNKIPPGDCFCYISSVVGVFYTVYRSL